MWRYIKIALLVLSLLFAGQAAGKVRIDFRPTLQIAINGNNILQYGTPSARPKRNRIKRPRRNNC